MTYRNISRDKNEESGEVHKMQTPSEATRSNSGAGFGIGAIILAAILIVGPIAVSVVWGRSIPTSSQALLTGFGAILFLLGLVITTVTRLYHRAPSDMAFVRTGAGGAKPVIDGGAIIVPTVHQVVWVTLRTMTFMVTRSGPEALITRDNLRADITAEFYIKVPKQIEAVQTAATSLGVDAANQGAIRELVEKKMESALRQVAAEMNLQDLYVQRNSFIASVKKHVDDDISSNGLALESVTISRLDQTPTTALRPDDNIFDAQGARQIAEITSAQKIATNAAKLAAEKAIKAAQVEKDQYVYAQDVTQAQAQANKDREVRIAIATADQLATSKEAELAKQAQIAEVERDQAIEVANVTKAQTVEVAGQVREQAAREAEIAKNKAVEVADRQRQITVANKEQELAMAQAEQLAAEATKAAKDQAVRTVQVTAEAEREKQKVIIDAQAEAETKAVERRVSADAEAYSRVATSQGEQDAAERQAKAKLTTADANQKAAILEAEGDKATQMVPVLVNMEKVAVDRQELANKSEFNKIAMDLQVQLAQIEADKQVEIERARAMASGLSSASMTFYGNPNDLLSIQQSFMRGQQAGRFVEGVVKSTPDEAKALLGKLAVLIEQRLGLKLTPEQIQEMLKEADSK